MSYLFRRRRYGRPRKRYIPSFKISPEAKKTIIVFVLFLLSIATLLAGFGFDGVIINYIGDAVSVAVGQSLLYFVVVIAFVVMVLLLFPDKLSINGANYIGIVLFLVSVTGLWHIGIPVEVALEAAKKGEGGGMLGMLTSALIIPYTGSILAITINIALFITAIVLTFNTSLTRLTELFHTYIVMPLVHVVRGMLTGIKKVIEQFKKEKDEDEEDDLYDEEEPEEEEPNEVEDEEPEEEEPNEVEDEEPEEEEEDSEEEDDESGSLIAPVTKRRKKKDLPLSLLDDYTGKPTSGDIKASQKIIKNKLASFKIDVEMRDVTVGPTITQYTLKPSKNVRLSKISALSDDLALELAAHPIRIEAPIPGKALVGIEVPNKAIAMVKLKTLLTDQVFRKRRTNLMLALGKDVAGLSWMENLGSMPHLLVAGSTGSGKSVCLSTMIVSLLYQNGPDDLKFIMVDPKRVELTLFSRIPHLLTPVITEMSKVINSLRWALKEMERRYQVLSSKGKRNISDYNEAVGEDKLPYIVIVIDELAELMSVAASDVESAVIRIAQMARAVGIHLIVATQRPSVDVITGLIKANIPTRIAFAVVSSSDSKTILDTSGADKLLGRGDMLFTNPKLSKPKRIQGVFLNDEEIGRVVDFLADAYEQEFDETVTEKQGGGNINGMPSSGSDGDDDELVKQAIEEVRRSQKASATFLQRKLSLGYARAARILDALEERGVVGPAEGAKPREVLIPRDADDMME